MVVYIYKSGTLPRVLPSSLWYMPSQWLAAGPHLWNWGCSKQLRCFVGVLPAPGWFGLTSCRNDEIGGIRYIIWVMFFLIWMIYIIDLQILPRWWFQRFFIFTPIWGNDPILTNIFQMGLKPPTRFAYSDSFLPLNGLRLRSAVGRETWHQWREVVKFHGFVVTEKETISQPWKQFHSYFNCLFSWKILGIGNTQKWVWRLVFKHQKLRIDRFFHQITAFWDGSGRQLGLGELIFSNDVRWRQGTIEHANIHIHIYIHMYIYIYIHK